MARQFPDSCGIDENGFSLNAARELALVSIEKESPLCVSSAGLLLLFAARSTRSVVLEKPAGKQAGRNGQHPADNKRRDQKRAAG